MEKKYLSIIDEIKKVIEVNEYIKNQITLLINEQKNFLEKSLEMNDNLKNIKEEQELNIKNEILKIKDRIINIEKETKNSQITIKESLEINIQKTKKNLTIIGVINAILIIINIIIK